MRKYNTITKKLFDESCQLIDGTDEIFELDLALWEYETLNKEELIKQSAYFKTIDHKETLHYKTCNLQHPEEIYKNSTFRTKLFFLNGKYSTGYATHGLFPYRGKFHPQMIRALLNILKVKKGDVVLDPMSGSGTLSVEANLLGINSIGIDLSPFCTLMGKVKTFALNINTDLLKAIIEDKDKFLVKLNKAKIPEYFSKEKNDDRKPYYEIILLAFLDTIGFAQRTNSSCEKFFAKVLERYILTIINFQKARKTLKLEIGQSNILQGNTLDLPLEDNSVDTVITSPPYSFAIDYLKNDKPQLEYLGYNINDLREKMIGLQGQGVYNKLELYFSRMNTALKEISRVTKKNSNIVIIIGTNDIQTKGIKLETKIIELAEIQHLYLEHAITKPIRGLQNTMKNEVILFFSNAK